MTAVRKDSALVLDIEVNGLGCPILVNKTSCKLLCNYLWVLAQEESHDP